METSMIIRKKFAADTGFLRDTIPKEKGGDLMLKLNLFALNVTVSVQKAKMTASRYHDAQRIKSMQDDLLTRRLSYSRFIR
jgi:Probable sporulation protein (Bac_small_yrzI).